MSILEIMSAQARSSFKQVCLCDEEEILQSSIEVLESKYGQEGIVVFAEQIRAVKEPLTEGSIRLCC